MGRCDVAFYQNAQNGRVPVLEWLDQLDEQAYGKCERAIQRLQEHGRDLPGQELERLRHEGGEMFALRVTAQNRRQARILLSFVSAELAVLVLGCIKKGWISDTEKRRARVRITEVQESPREHIYHPEE